MLGGMDAKSPGTGATSAGDSFSLQGTRAAEPPQPRQSGHDAIRTAPSGHDHIVLPEGGCAADPDVERGAARRARKAAKHKRRERPRRKAAHRKRKRERSTGGRGRRGDARDAATGGGGRARDGPAALSRADGADDEHATHNGAEGNSSGTTSSSSSSSEAWSEGDDALFGTAVAGRLPRHHLKALARARRRAAARRDASKLLVCGAVCCTVAMVVTMTSILMSDAVGGGPPGDAARESVFSGWFGEPAAPPTHDIAARAAARDAAAAREAEQRAEAEEHPMLHLIFGGDPLPPPSQARGRPQAGASAAGDAVAVAADPWAAGSPRLLGVDFEVSPLTSMLWGLVGAQRIASRLGRALAVPRQYRGVSLDKLVQFSADSFGAPGPLPTPEGAARAVRLPLPSGAVREAQQVLIEADAEQRDEARAGVAPAAANGAVPPRDATRPFQSMGSQWGLGNGGWLLSRSSARFRWPMTAAEWDELAARPERVVMMSDLWRPAVASPRFLQTRAPEFVAAVEYSQQMYGFAEQAIRSIMRRPYIALHLGKPEAVDGRPEVVRAYATTSPPSPQQLAVSVARVEQALRDAFEEEEAGTAAAQARAEPLGGRRLKDINRGRAAVFIIREKFGEPYVEAIRDKLLDSFGVDAITDFDVQRYIEQHGGAGAAGALKGGELPMHLWDVAVAHVLAVEADAFVGEANSTTSLWLMMQRRATWQRRREDFQRDASRSAPAAAGRDGAEREGAVREGAVREGAVRAPTPPLDFHVRADGSLVRATDEPGGVPRGGAWDCRYLRTCMPEDEADGA